MTLPFKRPTQILSVDDVLPVELANDAAAKLDDAREHLSIEHYVRAPLAGHHRVITIPSGLALFKVPEDIGILDDLELIWKRGPFERDPRWHGRFGTDLGVMQFEMRKPWYGAQIYGSSIDGKLALGCRRTRSALNPLAGAIVIPQDAPLALGALWNARYLLLAIYGER